MYYMESLLLLGLLGGMVTVASNPSAHFGAFGLVLTAGFGSGVLLGHGGPFLSLILFLIYLGGMLVVFAYSAALAADLYPEGWGSQSVMMYVIGYSLGLLGVFGVYWGEWSSMSWFTVDEAANYSVVRGDMVGSSMMYSSGGGMLFIGAWTLLLALFVALELTRGLSRGALRAV